MPKKTWPKDDKTAAFDDIAKPLRALVASLYTLKMKPGAKKGVRYEGLPFSKAVGYNVGELQAADYFKGDMLAYEAERDRDPMTVVIQTAIRLGIEQGRRIGRERDAERIRFLMTALDFIQILQDPKSPSDHAGTQKLLDLIKMDIEIVLSPEDLKAYAAQRKK